MCVCFVNNFGYLVVVTTTLTNEKLLFLAP